MARLIFSYFKVFDNVTILFSDVVGFTRICSQISPMEVVSMLNAMYTQFDQLSEKHEVYKVCHENNYRKVVWLVVLKSHMYVLALQ